MSDQPAKDPARHEGAADAFAAAADHLDQLADLADGPNANVIVLTLRPTALAFRTRAARELEAAQNEPPEQENSPT